MLIYRVHLSDSCSVEHVTKQLQEDYLGAIEHQHCSLADIQHHLGLSNRALFNTIMSAQRYLNTEGEHTGLVFHSLGARDPTEVSLTCH